MNRNTAIIITAATALLCGLPGLFACFMGGMFAVISQVPGADIDIGGSSDPQAALTTGLAMLCAGVLLVAIPALIGFFTLRRARPNTPPASS